ncbi:MAG: DUF4349 domain-containing protein [Opitutales bacterium]
MKHNAQMTPDDPMITAYALGELEDSQERARVEAMINKSKVLQEEVKNIRNAATVLGGSLATASLIDNAESPTPHIGPEHGTWSSSFSGVFSALAAFTLLVGIGIVGVKTFQKKPISDLHNVRNVHSATSAEVVTTDSSISTSDSSPTYQNNQDNADTSPTEQNFSQNNADNSRTALTQERLHATNAFIELEALNPKETLAQILDKLKEVEAVILSEDSVELIQLLDLSLVFKIPEHSMDEFIASLQKITDDTPELFIKTNDVTEEFLSIQKMLGAKRADEKLQLARLNEDPNIRQALAIHERLDRIRLDIETMQDHFDTLKDQINFSRFQVVVSQASE